MQICFILQAIFVDTHHEKFCTQLKPIVAHICEKTADYPATKEMVVQQNDRWDLKKCLKVSHFLENHCSSLRPAFASNRLQVFLIFFSLLVEKFMRIKSLPQITQSA